MPSKPRTKVGKYIELDAEQIDRLQAFAESRGETFAYHVRQAIDRHLAYPPPPPQKPPIPALPIEGEQPKRGRGRPRKLA